MATELKMPALSPTMEEGTLEPAGARARNTSNAVSTRAIANSPVGEDCT